MAAALERPYAAAGFTAARARGRRRRPGSEARVKTRPAVSDLQCDHCGASYPALSPRADLRLRRAARRRCSARARRGRTLRARFDARRRDGDAAVAGQRRLALPRAAAPGPRRRPSRTPRATRALYRRDAVARYAGHDDLALKHEGENPTGSFKDRGMTVAVDPGRARRSHRGRVRVDRQHLGVDGGLRRAGGPARARVRARRARSRPASSRRRSPTARARCSWTATSTRACAWCARPRRRSGSPSSTRSTPGGIEGQKTIVLEMLQQRGWEPPDWIVVPAGNLGNTSAFGKALREAQGARAHPPRAAGRRRAGRRARARSTAASGGASAGATRSRPRRWPPPSASATPPATTARCATIRETRRRRDAGVRPRDPRGEGGRRRRGDRLRAGLGRVGGRARGGSCARGRSGRGSPSSRSSPATSSRTRAS